MTGKARYVKMRRGMTLMELLVVIGIIAILIGASVGGYATITKSAENARAQELVSNAATALTALFQKEGVWPPRLAAKGKSDGQLDENVSIPLARGGYMSLTTTGSGKNLRLGGNDRFGIVTPWAAEILKKRQNAQKSDIVSGSVKIEDHILHYALDLDGDGVIKGASVGGEAVNVRATAIVWSIGKSGGDKGQPWPYKIGRQRGDIYSWTYGQTVDVQ